MSEKEQVKAMIDELPDDVTLDDTEYHLQVRRKILRGLEDMKSGRTLTHEEVDGII